MTVDRRELAAVFAGGAVGAVLRALLAEALAHDPGSWPWGTLVANVVAALLLGALLHRSVHQRALLGAGLCGGLSTFSTLQVELLAMLDHDRVGLAAGYAAVSVAAGLGAVALGRRLA